MEEEVIRLECLRFAVQSANPGSASYDIVRAADAFRSFIDGPEMTQKNDGTLIRKSVVPVTQ